MIRLFTALCKGILENLSTEIENFQESTNEYNAYSGKCPYCGVSGELNSYGSYERFLISIISGKPKGSRIKPLRFKCGKCKTTHALLPDIIIPYSPYSLRFVLTFLIAYAEREGTVAELCEHYGVAVSTLYRWRNRLLSHKELLLGLLKSQTESYLAFIQDLLSKVNLISERLQLFFNNHGFSFMQRNANKTSKTSSP